LAGIKTMNIAKYKAHTGLRKNKNNEINKAMPANKKNGAYGLEMKRKEQPRMTEDRTVIPTMPICLILIFWFGILLKSLI
jgi:hypothetical protein